MRSPDPINGIAAWLAPAGWRAIDIVSDLHLSEDTPATFAAFERFLLGTPASAVAILGDLFEVWVGDDACEAGFPARCTDLLRRAAARRPIAFMPGNRDFLVGARWLADTGIVRLQDPCALEAFGRRVVLSHGDALCLADTDYLAFRAAVRSDDWQRAFLAKPLPERLALAAEMRSESRRRQQALAREQWVDLDAGAMRSCLRDHDATALIHGHTHRPADEDLSSGLRRHVLSDWDLDHTKGARAEVLRVDAAGIRRLGLEAALERIPPVPA